MEMFNEFDKTSDLEYTFENLFRCYLPRIFVFCYYLEFQFYVNEVCLCIIVSYICWSLIDLQSIFIAHVWHTCVMKISVLILKFCGNGLRESREQ